MKKFCRYEREYFDATAFDARDVHKDTKPLHTRLGEVVDGTLPTTDVAAVGIPTIKIDLRVDRT